MCESRTLVITFIKLPSHFSLYISSIIYKKNILSVLPAASTRIKKCLRSENIDVIPI